MKLYIKNTVPWYRSNTRWEFKAPSGIIGVYDKKPQFYNGRLCNDVFNGVLSIYNNAPIDVRTEVSMDLLKSLIFSKKNKVSPPMSYPYKFYVYDEFLGGASQVVEKMSGRMGGYYVIRCFYKNDLYEAYQVPVKSDEIEVYIYKNNQTIAVIQSVSLVLDGQVEYYLYTEDDTDVTPLLLTLLCYDVYYYKNEVTSSSSKSYPDRYEKRDYSQIKELILRMDPQFAQPLYERHKNDIFT